MTLFIFEGLAQISKQPPDAKTEFRIAIAGPFTSFVLGTLFFTFAQLFPSHPRAISILLAQANTGLGLSNIVPGFALDGGRILRAILWKRKGNLEWATRISSRVGKAVALAIMAFAFFSSYGADISREYGLSS